MRGEVHRLKLQLAPTSAAQDLMEREMGGEQNGQMQADTRCQPAATITAPEEDYSNTAEQSVLQSEANKEAMSGPEETFKTLPFQQTSTHSCYRRNPQVTYTTGGNGGLSRRSRLLPHIQERSPAFPGQELPHQFSDADSQSELSLFSLTDSVEELTDVNVHTRVTQKIKKSKLFNGLKAFPLTRKSQRSPVRAKEVYHETTS